MRQMSGSVVVITGASSGIGKATALAFAQRDARLVLCARRCQALEATASACRKLGADTMTSVVDVADGQQVSALADQAIARFGGIDVWINNAGIDAFGSFESIPPQVFERIIQINFFGTVNGARAVLPHFRERKSGILINNTSIVGTCPTPFHSAYVASKFAIRGFSFALRQEVMDLPDVHVCVIAPASIDTPLWQRSANYSGCRVKPLDPVHPPEQVASVILELARDPQREVFAGATGWMIAEQHVAEPEMMEAVVAGYARKNLFQHAPAPPSDGALFEPARGGDGIHDASVDGGWGSTRQPAPPPADAFAMMAAPSLIAAAPTLFAWKLSRDLVRQLGRQLPMSPGSLGR